MEQLRVESRSATAASPLPLRDQDIRGSNNSAESNMAAGKKCELTLALYGERTAAFTDLVVLICRVCTTEGSEKAVNRLVLLVTHFAFSSRFRLFCLYLIFCCRISH